MKQVKWNDRITELNFSFHEISFVRYYQPPTKKNKQKYGYTSKLSFIEEIIKKNIYISNKLYLRFNLLKEKSTKSYLKLKEIYFIFRENKFNLQAEFFESSTFKNIQRIALNFLHFLFCRYIWFMNNLIILCQFNRIP